MDTLGRQNYGYLNDQTFWARNKKSNNTQNVDDKVSLSDNKVRLSQSMLSHHSDINHESNESH